MLAPAGGAPAACIGAVGDGAAITGGAVAWIGRPARWAGAYRSSRFGNRGLPVALAFIVLQAQQRVLPRGWQI